MKNKEKHLIHIKDIKKEFGMNGQVTKVIHGISLDIERGDYMAITGHSGSGKSTLMYIVGLLLMPTSGSYHFDGKDVTQLTNNELANIRNEKIGFVFQQFNLLPRVSSWENVALPLLYSKVPVSEHRKRAIKALESVGLGDRINFMPNQLSGGQQQRIAIARALINEPAILIADEPTGALDTGSSEMVIDIFDKLNKQGQTILMITHEKSIAKHAREEVQLRDGLIIAHHKKK